MYIHIYVCVCADMRACVCEMNVHVLTITYHPGKHFPTEMEVLEVAGVD